VTGPHHAGGRGEGLGVVAKLAAFALAVAIAFGVGLGVGAAVGPVAGDSAPAHHGTPVSTTVPAARDGHTMSVIPVGR
jgi:hypothetical protein